MIKTISVRSEGVTVPASHLYVTDRSPLTLNQQAEKHSNLISTPFVQVSPQLPFDFREGCSHNGGQNHDVIIRQNVFMTAEVQGPSGLRNIIPFLFIKFNSLLETACT